jgi:nucleoside-diphosphate-sugar epimerase
MHSNPFDKVVTCIQGRVLDIIVNLNPHDDNYLQPQYYHLDPKTQLHRVIVPANHAHGFLSLEQDSILVYHFNGHYTDENTTHIHYCDPFLGIQLPEDFENLILSEKDKQPNFVRPIDYLVFGGGGFIGSHIVTALQQRKKNFIVSDVRLDNTHKIAALLDLYSPTYVINAAGLTGTPNIFWCDDHKIETVETNITYQLTMAAMCHDRNIHLTVIGSGAIFKNDRMYAENDQGNFTENFYARSRIILEETVSSYPNVLYLRVNYPISSRQSPKNLLTKLISYSTIASVNISVTCLDDLCPILVKMLDNNHSGICNFVNDGTINLVDIVKIYQEKKDKAHVFVVEETPDVTARSSPNLSVKSLLPYQPLPVWQGVENCIRNYNYNNCKE